MTSVPDITRARPHPHVAGRARPPGRTRRAARRLEEAHKLLEQVANALGEVRRAPTLTRSTAVTTAVDK